MPTSEVIKPTRAKEHIQEQTNSIATMSSKLSWADEVHLAKTQSERTYGGKALEVHSIWKDFDINIIANVGFKFKCIILSRYRLIGEIGLKDIQTEIEYWQNAIICYVFGGGASPCKVLNGFIQRIWENYGINKVVIIQNEIVLYQ